MDFSGRPRVSIKGEAAAVTSRYAGSIARAGRGPAPRLFILEGQSPAKIGARRDVRNTADAMAGGPNFLPRFRLVTDVHLPGRRKIFRAEAGRDETWPQ